MKRTKHILSLTLVLCSIFGMASDVIITKVQQRYPWNGLVDIEFEIPFNEKVSYNNTYKICATNLSNNTEIKIETILDSKGNLLEYPFVFYTGKRHVVWDAKKDAPNFQLDTPIKISVDRVEDKELYLVVDLTTANFNVSYLSDVPEGGWPDEYKTSKLVLRKIKGKNFYIGVFEVTGSQWVYVMHGVTSYKSLYPVNTTPYETLSFCSTLSDKTGISFTLPETSQWEYACAAGSSGDYGLLSNGKEGKLPDMGWYDSNSSFRTHHVGTKTPNAWGLYDMHGNVYEWVDDRSGYMMGGGFDDWFDWCTTHTRCYGEGGEIEDDGFRVLTKLKDL